MSIDLGLADARLNCERHGAKATVTLRSGQTFTGRIKRESAADLGTVHMETDEGGWATMLTNEVVAVESHR